MDYPLFDYGSQVDLICGRASDVLARLEAFRRRATGDIRLTADQRRLVGQIIDAFAKNNADPEVLSRAVSAPVLVSRSDLSRDLIALEGRWMIRKSLGTTGSGQTRHSYLPLITEADLATTSRPMRRPTTRRARETIASVA